LTYGAKPGRHTQGAADRAAQRARGRGKGGKNAPAQGPARPPGGARPGAGGYDPLNLLTGDRLRRERNAAVELQYGPLERQLESERRISEQQRVNLGNWYQNIYLPQLQQAAAQQAAYSQAAQANMYQQANTAHGADVAAQNQLMQQAQADAAKRGATVDPSVFAQGIQGAGVRQQGLAQYGNLVGALGASQQQYLQGNVMLGAGMGTQALRDEGNRRMRIEQEGREVAREKGAFAVDFTRQARDKDRAYDLARDQFGLDVAEAAEDQRHNQAMEAHQRRALRSLNRDRGIKNKQKWFDLYLENDKFELEVEKFGWDKAVDRWKMRNRTGEFAPSGGKGGVTPSKRRENRDEFRRLLDIGARNPNKSFSWHYNAMLDAGAPPLMARVAALRLTGQLPNPKQARRFRNRYGFGVKSGSSRSSTPRDGNRPG
jgi:hypothetical protein